MAMRWFSEGFRDRGKVTEFLNDRGLTPNTARIFVLVGPNDIPLFHVFYYTEDDAETPIGDEGAAPAEAVTGNPAGIEE